MGGWPEHQDEELETRQSGGALRSWLVRGTHKVAIHPRRRTGGHRETRELLWPTPATPGDRSGWRALVSRPAPPILNAPQFRKGDRDILTMAYVEGHTNQEIGRVPRSGPHGKQAPPPRFAAEEHARDVGIWLAAFALVAPGCVEAGSHLLAHHRSAAVGSLVSGCRGRDRDRGDRSFDRRRRHIAGEPAHQALAVLAGGPLDQRGAGDLGAGC